MLHQIIICEKIRNRGWGTRCDKIRTLLLVVQQVLTVGPQTEIARGEYETDPARAANHPNTSIIHTVLIIQTSRHLLLEDDL